MKRIGVAVLGFLIAAAFSVVVTPAAMAFPLCLHVKKKATGTYEDAKCEKEKLKGEYVLATAKKELEAGVWCAKLDNASTAGDYGTAECKTEVEKGEYVIVEEGRLPLPLFSPAEGQLVATTSGTSRLSFAGNVITCASSVFHGYVLSSLLIGNGQLHYLGCTAAGTEGSGCEVNSSGSTGGLILTATIHGILGLILPSGGTGILFLPTSTKTWLRLAESRSGTTKCTPETLLEGSVAALIRPVAAGTSTTGKLIFALSNKKQAIKSIDLTHGLGNVEPELNLFFGSTGTLEETLLLTFAEATEVT